jgi:uncharacterized NAD(P)/FAD-binding protein YdhS
VRSYGEVHRHRIAPEIADILTDLIQEGQVRIYAGRIIKYREQPNFAEVTVRRGGTRGSRVLRVHRVINCTGSENDCRRIDQPLISSRFAHGLARPDPLFLGLDVDSVGALIDCNRVPSRSFFAVGPTTKGTTKGCLWEITAVPEIRLQCQRLAEHLARVLIPRPDMFAAWMPETVA